MPPDEADRPPPAGDGRLRSRAGLVAGAGLALVALLAGVLVLGRDDAEGGSGGGVPSGASGSYQGPCATARMQDYGRWRDRRAEVVVDTLDVRTWRDLSTPSFWTDCWGAGAPVVYGVAMVTEDDGGSLAEGARGAYDDVFRSLGRTLVAGGQGRAWLRLGFEFNGGWFPWTAGDDPEAFAAYHRRIVDVLRDVPGADFSFVWNPTIGLERFPAEQAWPGGEYVDAIGLDLYDVSYAEGTYPVPEDASPQEADRRRRAAWEEYRTMDHGLDWWVGYADDQDRPLALPEWGLVEPDRNGGGDNPYFVEQVHAWAQEQDLAFESYFDAAGLLGDHRLRGGRFPRAAETYRDLFGGGS